MALSQEASPLIFSGLKNSERIWAFLLILIVCSFSGLLGGISGALAEGSSMALFIFYDWRKLYSCLQGLESAYLAGFLCGAAAGLCWSFLTIRYALIARCALAESLPLLTCLTRTLLFSMLACILYSALFLTWSMTFGHAFGTLTFLVLISAIFLKWIILGMSGGLAAWFVLRRAKATVKCQC